MALYSQTRHDSSGEHSWALRLSEEPQSFTFQKVFLNPLLVSSLILQSRSCWLAGWLANWLCARCYEGERGGSCTLNTPTHCIIGTLSTSPMIAMPYWGAGLLFVFGKFTGERKPFSGVGICYLIKPGFSLATKNTWRNISVWRACISFLMCTAYLPQAVRR